MRSVEWITTCSVICNPPRSACAKLLSKIPVARPASPRYYGPVAAKLLHGNPVVDGTYHTKPQSLAPWYVTGFCDGEAAFTYSLQASSPGLSLYFNLKLHDRDRPLLKKIQVYFEGAGKIYVAKDPRPNAGLKAYYRVTNLDELQVIARHFDRYPLRGWKAKGYAIWRQMVKLKFDHYGHPPNDELIELAHQLSRLNRRNATAWLRKTDDRDLAAQAIRERSVKATAELSDNERKN